VSRAIGVVFAAAGGLVLVQALLTL